MTLTIHKLSTHCRSPKGIAGAGSLVDDVARGPLASELSAQLGPSLDRLPAVVRVRQLRVELAIPAKRMNASDLADQWAQAFTHALHRALAYPDGDGTYSIRRYQSQAEYNAALLQYLLTEGALPTWQFPELSGWQGQRAPQASHGFLLRDRTQIGDTIAQLARTSWLEPLLGIWDEVQLERLMQGISATEGAERPMTLTSLVELARAAAAPGGLHSQWSIANRRQAVRLWSRLARRLQLQAIWHGLRLLLRFVERPDLLSCGDIALLSDPVPFPQWCEVLVQDVALALQQGAGTNDLTWNSDSSPTHYSKSVTTLGAILDDLRPLVPSSASAGRSGKWVESGNCGVLLLLSTVQRLGIVRLASTPQFEQFGGPRAISFLLAALGMTLLGEWDPGRPVDPAVALFAGIFSEVDRAGLKEFFVQSDVRSIADPIHAETWPNALQLLATDLTRAFAQRIRGFRQASREAVVKQFLRIPGKVLIEEQRLLVILASSPWAVALHVSGMDESLTGIEWLPGRRVDFVLEGL